MAWPLASQFSAMLQQPEVAFRDPVLRRYSIERDRFRQPRPWAGAFAVVYKGLAPDNGPPRAIRVFTTESPERHDRYDAISAYLQSRRLNCLVEFEYREDSVRASGDARWYPLILMDWVQGETLFRWVAARCREGDRQALGAAAARWLDVLAELEQASIAHGDLQHANIMVTAEGQLKLVDYDCMCVPALVGRRNLEVGVEPYQHPQRNASTLLGPTLDHYSAMVIYVALKALAADPGLWQKHVEEAHHDKLLFRREDFLAPHSSPLVAELRRLSQHEVVDLTDQLLELVPAPIDAIPPLRQLAAPSFRGIERLLRAGEWAAAVEQLNRRGRFHDAPPHLKPWIEQAYQHVLRLEAWDNVLRIPGDVCECNDRELAQAWNESLFAGFPPAEAERPRIEAALERVDVVLELERLVKHADAAVSLEAERAVAECAAQLPPGYGYDLAPRAQQALERATAVQRLWAALDGVGGEAAVVATWRDVIALRCDRLVPPTWRPRIELAARRLPLIQRLQQFPRDLSADQFDQRLLEVWQEELLAGCADVQPWREAYNLAARRRGLLGQLATALAAHDDGEIVRLTEDPNLAGYPLPLAWSRAIESARMGARQSEVLALAIRNNDRPAFARAFDARLIRKYRSRFASHETVLCRWTQLEIVPLEGLGLAPALGRASLWCADRLRQIYCVTWTWPQQRYCDSCILAVCPYSPGLDEDPRFVTAHHRMAVDRLGWESGGGSRLIQAEPEWAEGYVAVWAMIDVGFRVFPSQPLILGRLQKASLKWLRSLRGLGTRRRGGAPTEPAEEPTGNEATDPAGAAGTDSGTAAAAQGTPLAAGRAGMEDRR